jgi:hypothetical protein
MPKLPDKFDLGGAPSVGRRPITQASASDFAPNGGLMVANEVVKGIGGLAKVAIAKQEEADEYELQKAIVDFDLEQEKRLDDAKRNAPPEAKDFTGSYRRGYDEAATGLMTKVPERLKPKVDEMLVRRGAAFEKRAYDFELAERDRWNIQDVQKNTSDLITHTMGKPESMEDNAQRGVAIIRASKLPQRQKIDAERKFLDTNAEFGIKAMIDREIEAGRDAGEVIERLRRVPRGSMAPPIPSVGGWTTTVGSVSEKYESAGKGVGFVSTGRGDPGGPSYGKHQLSSKDSMPAFLQSEEGAPYAERFKGLRPGTAAFNQAYNEIAREDPEGLGKAQHGFYTRTHYQPLLEHAKGKGLAVEDRGVQEALFSISVQHGGARKIVDAALSRAGEDPADQIKALYAARSRYVSRLGDLPDDTKASVLNRYKSEMKDALALVGQSGDQPQDNGVTRRDLGPVQVAEAKTGTMTDAGPDTGTALTKDGSATLTKDSGTVDDGGPKDDLEEADQAEWAYMSPTTRRKLINYARTAGRAVVTKGVDDDIARLRLGREPVAGPDGKTSLDRARAHMTNFQWTTKKREWDEAKLEHKELSGLRSMTNEEAADHVATMIERAEGNEDSIRSAARIQQKADARLKKILDMRDRDPVRSVNGFDGDEPDDRSPPLPNTREAMKRIAEARQPDIVTGPDGVPVRSGQPKQAMPPQQQWETLFEARLADQREVMPYETEKHRIISRREAEQLLRMPKDGKGLDYRAYRQRLEEAAKSAEAKFGPKYAKRALEEAIGFHLAGGSADQKARQASILSKMAKGEPVTSGDLRVLRDIEAVDGVSLSSGVDAMARIDRAGRSQGMPAIAPMGDPGRPAIGQGVAQPSAKQLEWLRANPDGWQAFDQRFGKGAAARALSGGPGNDPWGGRRQAVPKRDWRDDEKNIQPKSGWGLFGR